MKIRRKLFAVIMASMVYCAIMAAYTRNALRAMETPDQALAITGAPVIDSPSLLDWPADGGYQEPSLGEPTANLVNDLHAGISQCDMVLTTAGNYHTALKELWDLYLMKFPADDPLRNWYYTTSPPIAKQQITNSLVQFGNVKARCRPQIAVGPKALVDSLVSAEFSVGGAVPIGKTRGNVLLVNGTPRKPDPLPGNHTEILYAIRIMGNWTEKQLNATEKLMELFQSQEFTSILGKYGLDRP